MSSTNPSLQEYLNVATHPNYFELSADMREQVDACISRIAHVRLHPLVQASFLDRTANLVLTCIALLHQDPVTWSETSARPQTVLSPAQTQKISRPSEHPNASSRQLTDAMREQLEALSNIFADLLPSMEYQEDLLREDAAHTVLSCLWIERGEIGPRSVHH